MDRAMVMSDLLMRLIIVACTLWLLKYIALELFLTDRPRTRRAVLIAAALIGLLFLLMPLLLRWVL